MAASQRVLHRNLQAVLTASGRPDFALEEFMARLVTMQSNFEEGLKALEQFVYRIDERLAEQGQFSPRVLAARARCWRMDVVWHRQPLGRF